MTADNTLPPCDFTSTDLQAFRLRLGLSLQDVAALLKRGTAEDLRRREKGASWVIQSDHLGLLYDLQDRFLETLETEHTRLEKQGLPALWIVYPDQGDFEAYEPEMHAALGVTQLHRMLIYRLQELAMRRTPVVEFLRDKYADWLDGLPDTAARRMMWAKQWLGVYKLKDMSEKVAEHG